MRAPVVCLLAALFLLVGCDEKADEGRSPAATASPESSGPSALPDNLCAVIAPGFSEQWRLTEVTHATDGDRASCVLGGDSGDTRFTAVVTRYDPERPDQADAAFLQVCDEKSLGQLGEGGGRRCSNSTGTSQAAKLAGDTGVLVMDLASEDEAKLATVRAEMAGVEFSLLD